MSLNSLLLTTGVVTCGEQNATSGFADTDQVTRSRCAQDTVLSDEKLLHTIGSTNLRNDLGDFRVPVSSITADDEEGSLNSFRNGLEDGGDKVLRVMLLLEYLDLLAQTRSVSRVNAMVLFVSQ